MRINNRTIIERLPLDTCNKGDDVSLGRPSGANWSIGRVTLEKVKTLPGGGVQIKFRTPDGPTVRKINMPAGTIVDRHRAPTINELAAQPSLAPLPTAERDGMRYVSTHPDVDIETALDEAAPSVSKTLEPRERQLMLGMHAFDLAAASLGMSVMLAGGRLVRED